MMNTVWQRLDVLTRMLTPSLITGGLVILSVLPLHIPSYSSVVPSFALMAVFYWSLHRPDLLPTFTVFLVGILYDILTGGPMGVQACVLLGVYWVTGLQRQFLLGKSFLVVWWAFMMIAAAAAVLQWIIMSLIFATLIIPLPALFSFLQTAALYPLFARVFIRVQSTLPQVA